jgi:uncharacterized phiE125 gp8 family phage protein
MSGLSPSNNVAAEPITLAQARLHLKLDTSGSPPSHPDDTLVTALIAASRESAEKYTGLAIANQTYTLTLDRFPDAEINLQISKVNSITSISYVDTNGATQTFSSTKYTLDNVTKPSVINLNYNEKWPDTRQQPNAVTVTFNAGYTDNVSPNTNPIPKSINQAMLLNIGHLYANREAINVGNIVNEIPLGAMHLLSQHRINIGL